jgi:Fe-S-cluster containining protein
MDTIPVKVSNKSMKIKFHGCDPDYIRNTCHAKCENSSGSSRFPTVIALMEDEKDYIMSIGGNLDGEELLYDTNHRCPFQTEDNLCKLHHTAHKPFGCRISPLRLTDKNTLTIRTKYIYLGCHTKFKINGLPLYEAFRSSLDLLFGNNESNRIVKHLNESDKDIIGYVPIENYNKIKRNEMYWNDSKRYIK